MFILELLEKSFAIKLLPRFIIGDSGKELLV